MKVFRYNAAQMAPEERALRFAGRETDLGLLLDILRENVHRSSNQHVLVTGPRGCGKTMLLARIVDQVLSDEELSGRWYPIVASEDLYRVSSIGEFWLECVFHLARASKDGRHMQAYEHLCAEREERRLLEGARGYLLEFADSVNRRLLLVVENLQMLLGEQWSERDGWALRETLTSESRVMLLGTAVRTFEQIESAQAPLFETFLVHPLGPLDTRACERLWSAATGERMPGRGIRAIEILSGGNPRSLAILSESVARGSPRVRMEDLTALIDEQAEYLKGTADRLPPVERRVFVSLAELWQDSTAAEVAREARLTVNTASAQLTRLERRGAVLSRARGRRKLYRIAERLHCIYHLLRRHGDREGRVRAMVDFMGAYYGSESPLEPLGEPADEAVNLLASLVRQEPPIDPSQIRTVTEVAISLAGAGHGEKALSVIESSRSAPAFEPLAAGLKRYLGIEAPVPQEIAEVANDIVSDIRESRARFSPHESGASPQGSAVGGSDADEPRDRRRARGSATTHH